MSGGFGAVQRDILAKLASDPGEHVVTRWLDADDLREHLSRLLSAESLTKLDEIPDEEILRNRYRFPWARVTARYALLADVCGVDASPARVEYYRRAAHKLAAAGLVETMLVDHKRVRSDGVAYRHELAVRLL